MSETLDPIQEEQQLPVEPEKKEYANREEVLTRLSEIAGETTEEAKGEINYLKMQYYRLRQQETDDELKAFLDSDGDPSTYEAKSDELEPRLKELLNIQKEARSAMIEARNREMAENLSKKQEILCQMEAIAMDADGVGQKYNEFQDLQKQFKSVGAVDPAEVAALWKRYTQLGELFYDALKINKELRDLDFKKNLERKEQLCEEAEKLQEDNDVINAFRRLQDLHEEWKGIGPVAPNLREEIWSRFKAASTLINKKHQDHFEAIKAKEAANEAGKIALCEKLEAVSIDALKTIKDWEEKTKEVIALQGEWRKLGFANRKVNNALFERFRKNCDAFFNAKAEFYKTAKEEQSRNYDLKVALCEKAEALKDSTEWRKTTDLLVGLQKQWKEIGPVGRMASNKIWERFKSACDTFFEAKEKAVGGERVLERENLDKKQNVLKKMQEIKDNVAEATPQAVRDLMAEWQQIGHVPFKNKEQIHAEYQKFIDFFFENLDMKGARQRIGQFKERVKNQTRETVLTERQRLLRQMERLQNDLKTYENNLGFLSSKSGGGMMALMERKKEELKKEIEEIKQKISVVDNAQKENEKA